MISLVFCQNNIVKGFFIFYFFEFFLEKEYVSPSNLSGLFYIEVTFFWIMQPIPLPHLLEKLGRWGGKISSSICSMN